MFKTSLENLCTMDKDKVMRHDNMQQVLQSYLLWMWTNWRINIIVMCHGPGRSVRNVG